jgi:hypothetical protein
MCKEPMVCHGANHDDLIMYTLHLQNTVSLRETVLMRRGEAGTYYCVLWPGGPKGGPGPNNITYVLVFLDSIII